MVPCTRDGGATAQYEMYSVVLHTVFTAGFSDAQLYTEHGGENEKGVGHTARTRADRREFPGLEPEEVDGRGAGADGEARRGADRKH